MGLWVDGFLVALKVGVRDEPWIRGKAGVMVVGKRASHLRGVLRWPLRAWLRASCSAVS